MRDPEVILNLWYIQDTEGVIYSLRARAYVGVGSDDDKVELLRRFAEIDYLIARPFPVPEAFHVVLADSGTKLPVAYAHAVSLMNAPLEIFEAAIKSLNDDIPAQTKLEIPRAPLVCITTLIGDDGGNLRPLVTETKRL
jgi:hypothetical protein